MDVEQAWDYLIDNDFATTYELQLVTRGWGYNLETLETVLYVRAGVDSFPNDEDVALQVRIAELEAEVKDREADNRWAGETLIKAQVRIAELEADTFHLRTALGSAEYERLRLKGRAALEEEQ